ncbi:hypothetical protein GGR56DRAFT_675824 [Xylariaceae sp. FL0804]|nr:hypothetical protein GGR56DRAFT_675824 [Xylariaceae sp. FL0804]
MNKAKDSLKGFMSKTGHHDTTVHKSEAPAVEHETVKPTQHENINTAVDKEIHHDHYHSTVQPIADQEVLPEKHSTRLGEVQHRDFDHRDEEGTKARLEQEGRKFANQRVVEDTTHTQSMAPVEQGEHHHHHIHETVQPVVHKETVQPHVVHTTVPIHETHHEEAQHHGTSSLPAMTMDDYKRGGGVLGGAKEKFSQFSGQPHERGGIMSAAHGGHDEERRDVQGGSHGDFPYGGRHEGRHAHAGGEENTRHPEEGMGREGREGLDRRGKEAEYGRSSGFDPRDEGKAGHHGDEMRHSKHADDGYEGRDRGSNVGRTGVGAGGAQSAARHASNSGSGGILDKLNPNVDSTGQGNPGFMK